MNEPTTGVTVVANWPMICLVLAALLIPLQIFLSTRKNPWFGVFLPVFWFLAMTIAALALTDDLRTTLLVFLIFNIPSVIYLFIHTVCRFSVKQKTAELEKMKIRDLE